MNVARHDPRRLMSLVAATLVLPLALSLSVPLPAAASPQLSAAAPAQVKTETDAEDVPNETVVPEEQRDAKLGDGWQSKNDIAWTTVGDSAGLHILTARMDEGYQWRQLATLSVDAFETDRWIGNACMTSDQRWLAVTYAPRSFTNDEALFTRGAFAAFVNLESGEVTPLSGGYGLAYFNPGCGQGDQVSLAQYSDEGATRISTFSASTPEAPEIVEVDQTITSIVPTEKGVNGITGRTIVNVDGSGQTTTILEADGLAFNLSLTADGGMAYLQHDGETSQAMYVSSTDSAAKKQPVELAAGPLDAVGLSSDASGSVYVTGEPETMTDSAPAAVKLMPGTGTRSEPSSTGELLLEPTGAATDQAGTAEPQNALEQAASIEATASSTDSAVEFTVPTALQTATGGGFSASTEQQRSVNSESATSPVSSGSVCSVPRNDPAIQALQPRPAEVEWAVNQGIRQTLHSSFPLPALSGGGRVPAQIMLGILAQESNFWQASKYVVPGVTGNPLVGNYYGINRDGSDPDDWWQINYEDGDCGYGIAQVTTGMEVGEMPYSQQLAIAVDYKANIARGLQILIEKWNESRAEGLMINDGNPKYLENWFYALWTYNTGFKPNNGGRWGVGWLNNPINDLYAPNRTPFLDGKPSDAAHPQDWP